MLIPSAVKTQAEHRENTYSTLASAAALPKDLGLEVRCGEKERSEEELKEGWRSSGKTKKVRVSSVVHTVMITNI